MEWQALVEIFTEERFLLFPVMTNVISMAAFAVFAIPLTWIAWKKPAWAEKYRIQKREADPQKVIGPSIGYWLRNNAALFAVTVAAWPLLRQTGIHWGPLPPWYVILIQVVFFIYLDDFLYYWMHRTLHHKRIYKKVHAVHHRIFVPWAVTAHYMHPLEFVMTGGLLLVGPLLLEAHIVTLWIWVIIRQWEAAEGHCGYSLPWNPSHLVPLYGGVEYHDFHHAKFHGNYSGFLGYLDRIFGEYSKGYREHLAAKRARPVAPPQP
jgi:4-alpha-methyl-delta7-sterol-4alpha-methyl oxidase